MFSLIVIPISLALFWISCARSGISKPSHVVSSTSKPSAMPASASSCLACSMSCWRCGTLVSVYLNTGANGESLPSWALPLKRPSTSPLRSIESASAWRTSLSLNGSLSVRRWTWRCVEAFSVDRLHVRVGEQRAAAGDGELRDHVDLARLQREHARLLLAVEADLGRVRVRLALLVPVLGVLAERRALPLRELVEDERARAVHGLLVVAVVVGGQDDRVVVVRAQQVRERAVRRLERELDRGGVGGLRAVLGQEAGEGRQRLGRAVGVGEAVDRGGDVLGRHLLAVVELDALADLERPHRGVLVGLPALGQARHRVELGVRPDEVLAALREHREAAVVGDRDRVDRAGRRVDRRGDVAALLHALRLLVRARRVGAVAAALVAGSARARQEADRAGAHAEHRAAADELAPVDPALAVGVDEMVLHLAAAVPDRIDPPLDLIHHKPSSRLCATSRSGILPDQGDGEWDAALSRASFPTARSPRQ